jgi:asparagine synthase (glutamine-hydrolysing)
MCGIFSYLGTKYSDKELIENAGKIVHRGPDSTINKRINEKLFFTFHRLAINGLNSESNQPFEIDGIHLICNGEIFNFKDLIKQYGLYDKYKSDSDCEIILHLYMLYGIDETCKLLDGEFAFILYDSNEDTLYIARDHLGIRSLYWSFNQTDSDLDIIVCSELKGIIELAPSSEIKQFPPSA